MRQLNGKMAAGLWHGAARDEHWEGVQGCARGRYHWDGGAEGDGGKCSCSQKAVSVEGHADVRRRATGGVKGKS